MLTDKTASNPMTTHTKLLLMLAAVIVVYLFAATRTSLWDRDEPRFSRATYEMVESGNYLYPTFNGELRPDKPIMIYWVMSLPVRALWSYGPNAMAARFAAAFGTALSCLFTFFIARRLFDSRTALWSVGILASTLLIFMIGTAATADSILLPAMLAAVWVFYRALDAGRMSVLDTLYMTVALAFALLTKGPVGYLPVLVILTTLLLRRKHGTKFWPIFGPTLVAMALAAGIFVLWALPANNATGGVFAREGIGKHVLGRSINPMESHGGEFFLFLPYYFIISIFTFFPWILHLPATINNAIGSRLEGVKGKGLIFGWALPVIVLMTFVATKLPHYVILAFPAFAIATAAFLTGHSNSRTEWDRKWLRGGIWFYGIANGGFALALIVAPFFLKAGIASYIAGPVAGLVMLIGGTFVNRYQLREDTARSTAILIKTNIIAGMILLAVLLPGIDSTKIPYQIAKAVVRQTDTDTPVAYCNFREPSLNFYIGRPIDEVEAGGAGRWLSEHPGGVLIIPQTDFDKVRTKLPDARIIAEITGFNYSNGDRETILAVRLEKT